MDRRLLGIRSKERTINHWGGGHWAEILILLFFFLTNEALAFLAVAAACFFSWFCLTTPPPHTHTQLLMVHTKAVKRSFGFDEGKLVLFYHQLLGTTSKYDGNSLSLQCKDSQGRGSAGGGGQQRYLHTVKIENFRQILMSSPICARTPNASRSSYQGI